MGVDSQKRKLKLLWTGLALGDYGAFVVVFFVIDEFYYYLRTRTYIALFDLLAFSP